MGRLTPLRAALGTLTVLPVGGVRRERLRLAPACFPLVGLGLGLVLAGLAYVGAGLPDSVVATGIVSAQAVLTGGLHLDGWADTWDALGSHADHAAKLRILHDPQIGAHGSAALGLLLLAKVAALTALAQTPGWLVVFPVISRFAIVPVVVLARPARQTGLARGMHAQSHRVDVVISAASAALVVGFVGGLGPALVALALGWAFAIWLSRTFRGHTGDTYGAVVEATELVFLTAACASY